MAMSPGLFRKTKENSADTSLRQKEKEYQWGVPGMTKGMQGGNRLYAGSFWHQVRKKPELRSDKSKKI